MNYNIDYFIVSKQNSIFIIALDENTKVKPYFYTNYYYSSWNLSNISLIIHPPFLFCWNFLPENEHLVSLKCSYASR